jgi:hypothetical protein
MHLEHAFGYMGVIPEGKSFSRPLRSTFGNHPEARLERSRFTAAFVYKIQHFVVKHSINPPVVNEFFLILPALLLIFQVIVLNPCPGIDIPAVTNLFYEIISRFILFFHGQRPVPFQTQTSASAAAAESAIATSARSLHRPKNINLQAKTLQVYSVLQ